MSVNLSCFLIYFLSREERGRWEGIVAGESATASLKLHSFFFNKNVVFPAQAEYSYFSADFRLKIFLYGVSITSVWYLDSNRAVICLQVQVFSFCWLVSSFRERNNFIRLC